jgi:hypothetical protein
MMHERRRWCVSEVESAEVLARMLTASTWTLCSGFSVKAHDSYLFLNDATHEDGALEMAVVKKQSDSSFLQVESITFSWATEEEALAYIRDALAGKFDAHDFARPVTPRIDPRGQHRDCHLCA